MRLLVLLPLMFFTLSTFAQNYCGYTEGRSEWLQEIQRDVLPYVDFDRDEDFYVIPAILHITGEDDGTDYYARSLVDDFFVRMNEKLMQCNIQLFIQSYHYIPNSDFHNHADYSTGRRMMSQNNEDRVINIYVNKDAAGNCGYYTPGQDAVSLNYSCLPEPEQTAPHEIGHMLSLPHTFSGWEGRTYDPTEPTPTQIGGSLVEHLNRDNCTLEGDGFCDTEPDYISDRWSCTSEHLSRQIYKDPEDSTFKVNGEYIMGYSFGDCGGIFTEMQCAAMQLNIDEFRSDYISQTRPYTDLIPFGKIQLVSPASLEEVDVKNVLLKWRAIENVDYYHLLVSKNLDFDQLVMDVKIQDTSMLIPNLEITRGYFWKVGAWAAHSPSITESSYRIFFPRTNVGIEDEYFEDAKLSVIAQELLVEGGSNTLEDVSIFIYNMQGQELQKHYVQGKVDRIILPLNPVVLAHLPNRLIVRMRDNNGHLVSKVLIN